MTGIDVMKQVGSKFNDGYRGFEKIIQWYFKCIFIKRRTRRFSKSLKTKFRLKFHDSKWLTQHGYSKFDVFNSWQIFALEIRGFSGTQTTNLKSIFLKLWFWHLKFEKFDSRFVVGVSQSPLNYKLQKIQLVSLF